VVLSTLALVVGWSATACAQSKLAEFAARATPQEFFPHATRFGAPQGEPPIQPVYAEGKLLGFLYLNSDFTGAVGYSGKSIHMLVAIDAAGVITGFKLVDHKEPIVLVGVPERRVVEALNKLIGIKAGLIASGQERPPQPDIVSGATVTIHGRQYRPLCGPPHPQRADLSRGGGRAGRRAGIRHKNGRYGGDRSARLGRPSRRRLHPQAQDHRGRNQSGVRSIR
jgi:transcriptional regulator of nitric oxide reductase